jgi:hypothetical protein
VSFGQCFGGVAGSQGLAAAENHHPAGAGGDGIANLAGGRQRSKTELLYGSSESF